ncbi:threonine aldolase family protein [Reichenbachiella versicolor]|uniref:threonine aldolase family protein n=1 Tax=Reichenbachiella versicolor TaxID=1821036 RepID=UPI001FEA160A|nr:GntG family PLP-dependent aldolase [Reichenbachiella versicolor]
MSKKEMIIDLRNDSVTKPSIGMLEHMMLAKVGDDVLGEDPTVAELEKKVAGIFGHEAALFCPSGTMANQIAININTNPGEEMIVDRNSYIYLYEGGSTAFNSQVSMRSLEGDHGRMSPLDITENINPVDITYNRTTMIALEHTVTKGGGSLYDIDSMKQISQIAKENNIKMHLDGARVFNAIVKSGVDPTEIGSCFDTIMVCFSKGLGAPMGAALLGKKGTIARARRLRKVMGGGMRQVGYLAAAAIYALNKNIKRLDIDHKRANELANIFEDKGYIDNILAAGTNIVILSIDPKVSIHELLRDWNAKGIKALPYGKNEIRLVTHMDFNDDMLLKLRDSLV